MTYGAAEPPPSRWRSYRHVDAAGDPGSLGDQLDASALPFGEAEFDACRADRTLQHVPRPQAALTEMVRVTGPSGRVVVTESRWGLVAPSLNQRLTDAVLELTANGVVQAGWIGARFPAMFERAGLTGVQSVSSDHTVCEHDEFFRFTHLDRSAEDVARVGALTPVQATAWIDRLSDLLRRGEAFAMVLVLHVAGAKLAAG